MSKVQSLFLKNTYCHNDNKIDKTYNNKRINKKIMTKSQSFSGKVVFAKAKDF